MIDDPTNTCLYSPRQGQSSCQVQASFMISFVCKSFLYLTLYALCTMKKSIAIQNIIFTTMSLQPHIQIHSQTYAIVGPASDNLCANYELYRSSRSFTLSLFVLHCTPLYHFDIHRDINILHLSCERTRSPVLPIVVPKGGMIMLGFG